MNPTWASIVAGGARVFRSIFLRSTTPSDRLMQKEDHERLILALSWSSEEERELISRHPFEERGHVEIAERLAGISRWIRQRYTRAVESLRMALEVMELLDGRNVDSPRQEVIVRHYIWRAGSREIGKQLGLPEKLVTRWIDEARPLLRNSMGDTI